MRADAQLSGVRFVALVLTLLLAAGPIPPVVADLYTPHHHMDAPARRAESQTSLSEAMAGVDSNWWSAAQENIRQMEYAITWQEQTYLSDLAAAYQAPNRAQNLRTYFTPEGPIVIPRTWTEETDIPPWRWAMRLAAWGQDGASEAVSPAALEVEEDRIEYRRGDPSTGSGQSPVEWYRNDEAGLLLGFTLLAGQAGLPLRLDLVLDGDLIPEIVHDGAEIEFRTSDGSDGLMLGVLRAEDATSQPLASRLALEGSTLSIWIEAAGAEGPIQVEASITGLSPDDDWGLTFGEAGAEFGSSVATAGDVDGDGYSEVIVGAPYYDGGRTEQGGAFVYHGSPGGLYTFADWYKVSNQSGAHFGWSVATAGDVDGDGFADVIVGAPDWTDGQDGEGGSWVYHGSAGGLETVPATYDQGNQAGAGFGASVATAGDVNGDGFSDVIVGAPLYNNGQSEEGMAWVWHGSPDGLSELHDWHAEGDLVDASFGQSVATAGDVNGDGYADIIVGATRYTAGQSWEGAAFVWLGSENGVNNNVDGNPTNEHRHLQIDSASARFGWSVSTAGDVNGDGYADVIVGAPYYTNGQGLEGGAWLYLGSDSGLNVTPANQDEGNQANANFGMSVATAGDVNGDGRADVIVGAPGYTVSLSQQGRAWLWYGQPTAAGISTSYDWRDAGEQAEANFGTSVATAGDVDGDGYSDLIVGAPGHASAAGRGYVYHGGADPLAEDAGWTKRSNQEYALFGASVGTAGDVNGDGFADVIVGSPRWDSGQDNEGAAWVYLGQATGLDTVPHWYRQSDHPGAEFGSAAGTAGDVNGDGYDDVIVGAPYWHNPETDEGAAFVYGGSSTGLSETAAPLWSKASNQTGAEFGFAVATAGDVNGDGYADIVVGAPSWTSGGDERGAVWLYYGSASGTHLAPDWYTPGEQADALYGHSVGTAGDVNGDGCSDLIVGAPYWQDDAANEGRAWVYLGSKTGLRYDEDWHAEGNNFIAQLGHSVGTAGDVNGDGFSDVIVGAPGYGDDGLSQEGKVWVFHGSSGGLDPSSSWSREGGQNGAHYGWSVGTAGDVNGDGYADAIIGIELWSGGMSYEGGASVYHGSSTGLGGSWTWHGEGEQASAHYGTSVGTAGDVNGDGYADVIVGAPNYNQVYADEGFAFLYFGNGGPGVSLQPRQQHPGGAPLAHLGLSDGLDNFRVRLRAGTPFGRGRIILECEAKPLGTEFTGSDIQAWGSSQLSVPGSDKYIVPHGLLYGTPYHWRVRWRYDPVTTPFMPASRWLTVPWNGWNETDLRTSGSRVLLPVVLRNHLE